MRLKRSRFMNKIYRTEGGRWLLAVFVSFSLIGIIFLIFRPVFMTIDDPRIRFVYAGYASGEPCGNYLFCNVILGSVIAWLYRLFANIPWYVIYQFVLIGFGCSAVGKTIYKLCYRKNVKVYFAVLIHITEYLVLCVSSTVLMHFEITAAIIGTAAAALLLGLDDNDGKVCQYVDIVVSAVCLFLTLLISKSNFYVICCYLSVALLYQLLRNKQTHHNKIVVRVFSLFLPLAIIGTLAAFYCNDTAKSSYEWKAYLSYDDYRVSFWDYPHVTYDDNPKLFESIGWTKTFYRLVEKKMYFLDERFHEDALSAFVEPFSWFNFMSADEMLQNASTSFSALYKEEPIIKFQGILAELILLIMIGIFYRDKQEKENFPIYCSALCNHVGTFLLLVFLAIRGRFPLRAWLSCFIPFGTVMLIQFLRLCHMQKIQETESEVRYARKKFIRIALAAGCSLIFVHVFQKGILTRYSYRSSSNAQVSMVENYCISNQENIYVYDPYFVQDYRALTEYQDVKTSPLNMLIWGSSYIYTPVFYRQMQYLGYESFSTENLFDKNVYVVTDGRQAEDTELFLYLEERYSGVRYEIKDRITDDCAVYKLYKD